MRFWKKPPKYTERLEVEISTRCVARCSECPRTTAIRGASRDEGWNSGFLDPEVLYGTVRRGNFKNLIFCGSYGDPIYHPEICEIVSTIGQEFPQMSLCLETNGSHRSAEFWEKFAKSLVRPAAIVFSIDGLADTNAIYREGTDWNSIMTAVRTLRKHYAGWIAWKWIVFRHNQHQVVEAYHFAKDLGFNEFKIVESRRHNEHTRPTATMDELRAALAEARGADVLAT